MKAVLVTLEYCKHCAKAKKELQPLIETGELEELDLNEAIEQFGVIDCMRRAGGYGVPTIVLVDEANKVVKCMKAGGADAVRRALSD